MWPAAECSALAHREPSGTHPRDRLPILWVSLAQSPSLKVDPTLASTPTKSLTVTKAKWSRSGAPASSPTAGENSGQGSLLRRASLSLWEGLALTAFTRIGLRHKRAHRRRREQAEFWPPRAYPLLWSMPPLLSASCFRPYHRYLMSPGRLPNQAMAAGRCRFHPMWGMQQLAFAGSNQTENRPDRSTPKSYERKHHG